jgi:BASS family bile acid:Na+ symporter
VATFVAHGDVALSVLMTAASTVAAAVMTPTLTSWLAGAYIAVDGWVCWRMVFPACLRC